MANTKKGSQTPTEFPITFDLVTGSIQDEGALAAIAAAGGGGGSTPLINNLTSTSATSALTAAMGKSLKDSTDNLTTVVSQKVVIGGDLGGTAAAPVVAKVNGVTVTGTPTSGQVLTASSGSAASWQAPSGGGGGGSVTINTTLTSTSTTEAASASTVKTLQDTKAPRGGPGAALGATYTAIDADDGKIWPTPVNVAVTVNTGLIAGFGQGFTGAGVVSFTGTATVTDKRTSGATNPVCSLVNIGTNTYEIWGTKS